VRARKPEHDSAAMSVIIDDRADVWEEASRKSLLQVGVAGSQTATIIAALSQMTMK
jgi:hypothetical protein